MKGRLGLGADSTGAFIVFCLHAHPLDSLLMDPSSFQEGSFPTVLYGSLRVCCPGWLATCGPGRVGDRPLLFRSEAEGQLPHGYDSK